HHTDDIMCLRVNPSRDTAVSGQIGSKPTIFTWDACTGEKKQRIKIAKGARGIKTVAINSQGWICAADLHNEHQVYCFDQSGNNVFKEKGDTNIIYDCAWHPSENRFATAGKKHLYFWDATKPGGEKKKGIFNGHEMCSFASVAFDESGTCWSGGSNGKIYCWDDNRTCKDSFQVGKGFICALQYINGKLWAGGKDGKVNCIDTTTKQVEKCIEFGYGNIIRAIDVDNNGNILVGQRDGTITCVDASGNKTNIMSSHSDGEVWGLA
ncbi:hypothetical protein, partial [Herbaspirillum sp.]|uniref:WD40 repeat domain-containing protein n=1 Tax=Herbaspirillum sp. TaxID=1890675 RepID=UPI00258DAEFE